MKTFSAFCIAAPRSGEGKTTVSLALMRLLTRLGNSVQPFKCGPDYIDPTFHSLVTGRACSNLDTWMMGEEEVKRVFSEACQDADISVCEGVMGLFDGKIYNKNKEIKTPHANTGGLPPINGSSAHCAKVLGLPIILVVNARGMASSIAALVTGFVVHAEKYGLQIAGIIANNVGSARHAQILKDCLEEWNLPPMVGFLPREDKWKVSERQLGLTPCDESRKDLDWANSIADILEENIDVERLLEVTKTNFDKVLSCQERKIEQCLITSSFAQGKTLGVARDQAFCFYYDANLKALEKLGYKLEFFSPMFDKALPKVDALYFGGGYPEVFCKELSQNTTMRQAIYDFAINDGHIFAECGGYMYLTKELLTPSESDTSIMHAFPMCGVINGVASMGKKMRSLGYRSIEMLADSIFYKNNEMNAQESSLMCFHGHEFHWSDIELFESYEPFVQINGQGHGVSFKNVRASYLHFYFAHYIYGVNL